MYADNCKANLRQDRTSRNALIMLPERSWSILAKKQKALAAERGVNRVSRAVALAEILDEYEEAPGYAYDPTSLTE